METENTRNNFKDIFMALPVWDQQEALESLGINLKLSDEAQINIAGEKAKAEKEEELKEAKESQIKLHGYFEAINSGKSNQEALNILFRK